MSSAPAEVMFFNLHVTSLPLNFSVIINPIMMKAINIPESGSSLIKGPTGKIVGVKAIGDADCPQTDILVPSSVLYSLDASVGDSVPMLAFNGTSICEAIKVQPLFHDIPKSDYAPIVTKYFQNKNESFLIEPDSYFSIDINNVQRQFLIQFTIPDDRCFTTEKTKVYFSDPPAPIEETPLLPLHFSDLVLRKSIKETIRNCLYLPLHEKELFSALEMPTSNAVMVYGGDRNGKTSFLCAVAKFMDVPNTKFVNVKRLVNAVTKAEKSNKKGGDVNDDIDDFINSKLNEIFSFVNAKKKDYTKNILIVLDDIDSLARSYSTVKFSNQRRLLASFYTLIDKALEFPNVAIVASAKSPSDIDDALIKPGRFNYEISLDAPNQAERTALVKMFTRSLNIATSDINQFASQYTIKMSRGAIKDFVYKGVRQIVAPGSGLTGTDLLSAPQINEIQQKMIVFSMRTELLLSHFGSANRSNANANGDFFDDLLGQDQGQRGRRPNAKSNQNRRNNRDNPFEQEARDKFPSMGNERKGNLPQRNTSGQEALEELRRLSAESIKNSLQNNISNAQQQQQQPAAANPSNMPARKNRADAYDGNGFEARPGQRKGLVKKKLRNDPFAVLDEKDNNEANEEPEGPFSENPSKNAPFNSQAPEGVPKRKGDRIVGTVVDDVENPFAPQAPQQEDEQAAPQRQRFNEEDDEKYNDDDDENSEDQATIKNNPFGQAALGEQRPLTSRKYVPPSADD